MQPSQRVVTATASDINSRVLGPSRFFLLPAEVSSRYPLMVSGLSCPSCFTPPASCLRYSFQSSIMLVSSCERVRSRANADSRNARRQWRDFTLLLENPATLSNCDRFGTARRIELIENGFDVCFHGPHGDTQLQGDALVAATQHHVSQYVRFPGRQRWLLHPLRNSAGDQWTESDTTDAHRAQTVDQILKTATEQKITACSLLQCAANARFAVIVRQDYDSMAHRCGGHDESHT